MNSHQAEIKIVFTVFVGGGGDVSEKKMEKFCSSPSLTRKQCLDLEFEIQSTASPSNLFLIDRVCYDIAFSTLTTYTLSIHANETFPSLKPFVRPKNAI